MRSTGDFTQTGHRQEVERNRLASPQSAVKGNLQNAAPPLSQSNHPKGASPAGSREENFVREYLIDLHGTKAAIRAGYSPRTAAVQASDLLKRPHIIGAIRERRDRHARRLDISAERVLDEIAACAFSNMQDFWPVSGERIDLSKMNRRLTAAVAHIKIKETVAVREDGKPTLLERETELRLHNKIAALDKLGNHLGLFVGEKKDSLLDRIRKMTPEQRVARMEEIIRIARERYGHLIEHEPEEQDGDDALDTDAQSGDGTGH